MTESQKWGGRERRVYRRFHLSIAIELLISQPGSPPYSVKGTSMNISRGGVLLQIDRLLTEGVRCQVVFPDAAGHVEPQAAAGKILYRRASEDGKYAVVVQFDEPLDAVSESLPPSD